jgi:chromosome segregation ATPase
MLWTDERIEKSVDIILTAASRRYAVKALEEMRDEYERIIGTMREDAVRAAVAYEARIAELESKLAACIELDEAKLQQVDSQAERIHELEEDYTAARDAEQEAGRCVAELMAHNDVLRKRIAELEAELIAAKTQLAASEMWKS